MLVPKEEDRICTDRDDILFVAQLCASYKKEELDRKVEDAVKKIPESEIKAFLWGEEAVGSLVDDVIEGLSNG